MEIKSGRIHTVLIALAACLSTFNVGFAKDLNKGYVWWEAENSTTNTFPPSYAFRAANDKEKDLLSGGAWLQTDKSAGAIAEWTVSVPEDGTYNFWVRKFWKHGTFSWHFNDQAEQKLGREITLVDNVGIRAGVCANWVNIGEVTLKKGENTLYIKMDADATIAAFDCWLLTTENFEPNGTKNPAYETVVATEPDENALDMGVNDKRLVGSSDGFIWWEAEDFITNTFPQSNMFAPANDKERETLSNGKWLQTDKGANATAEWIIDVPIDGTYNLWVRKFWKHGPFSWHFNDQPEKHITTQCTMVDSVQMRQFVCANWVPLGEVTLKKGKNTLYVKMASEATATGFDCWLLTTKPFVPNGVHKPGEKYNTTEVGWFNFEPTPDKYLSESMFDLRSLSQKRAGDDGFLKADGFDIVYGNTGEKAKFWSVTSGGFGKDHASVDYLVRKMAKYGINMVRVHCSVNDKNADDPSAINYEYLDGLHYFVAALAKEGIYTKLSFNFPLWFQIDDRWKLPGYKAEDGKNPYSLLFYNPRMQEIYKAWAKGLMTTMNPYTGKSFADDPAVGIVEIVNEDGLLFWTFIPYDGQPAEVIHGIEKQFGDWLVVKYGSLEKAFEAWGTKGVVPKGDDLAAGRVGLYHPGFFGSFDWAVSQRNQKRAVDQLTFQVELQRNFYKGMSDYYRNELGVKCLISASNWHTVDSKNLGALEKYTYTVCDVIDRHGYLGGVHEGQNSSWSVRPGHTFKNRSGLLVPDSLTKELQYGAHPHIISEYNYPTPNRFRTEGVYMASTYGSLDGTDAFFYFSMHTPDWQKVNTKFPVYTPGVFGQFPAFSYIYREGIVEEGPVVAQFNYNLDDLLNMKGTDLVESSYMDELRKADILKGHNTQIEMPTVVDPLAYYVGQVRAEITDKPSTNNLMNLAPYIDRTEKTVSSATKQLFWDWGKGYSTMNTPRAQSACGFLKNVESIILDDVTIKSDNEYSTIAVVAMDGKPIKTSENILVQVMTEDRNFGFQAIPFHDDKHGDMFKIKSTGEAPLIVKNIAGNIEINCKDAKDMHIYSLDYNGYKVKELKSLNNNSIKFDLKSNVIYYSILK